MGWGGGALPCWRFNPLLTLSFHTLRRRSSYGFFLLLLEAKLSAPDEDPWVTQPLTKWDLCESTFIVSFLVSV